MALPFNGSALATTEDRKDLVRKAAKRIMQLVEDDVKPRDIVTADASG